MPRQAAITGARGVPVGRLGWLMATRAAKTETTYEIYVLEGKRWQLHARYRSHERDSALAEAKDIDRRGGAHGVKVVREVFYPDYNKTEEAVIFVGQQAARQSRVGGAEMGDVRVVSSGDYPFDEGEEKAPSGLLLAWRIVVITVFSLGFGILSALIASSIMAYLVRENIALPISASAAVFIAFITGVIIVALPMLTKLVAQIARAAEEEEAYSRPAAKPTSAAKPKESARKKDETPSFTVDFARDDWGARRSEEKIDPFAYEDEELKEPWWKIGGWFGRKTKSDEPEPEPEPAYYAPPPTAAPVSVPLPAPSDDFSILVDPEPLIEEVSEPEDEIVPPQPEPEAQDRAVDFEQQRLFVMRFLGGAIAAIKTVRPQLDAFTKFAFDLALSGACEVIAKQSGIGENDRREILREAVEMIGTKPELARAFSEKYESYFQEARYKQMADLGREAMSRFLAGDPQPFSALPAAIENWDKPQLSLGAQQSITTIFFTDMVGSTFMTQEKGDFAVQELVRRHNAIVRSALAEHGGREIKHTGDGIMATCPTAASAVQACIDIQKAILSFNATKPPIPLEVRIGLNAGEMIVEENDVFGTTVQMAARICSSAKPGQILASQAVRDLAASRAESLKPIGLATLKGFKDPVSLFEAVWSPAPTAPAAPAAGPGSFDPSAPFFPQSQP